MPPIIPDAPAWLNALVILSGIALITGGTVWVATLQTRRRLTEVSEGTKAVQEQVQNSHQTNLRTDLDTNTEAIHRIERHIADLSKTMRALERSLDRRYQLHTKELEDAVEDRKRDIESLREEIKLAIHDHPSTYPGT